VVKANYSYHSKKFAFTMIELIFAIVIIAIAVVSLPVMTQVVQKGTEGALAQEAIFAAATELMGATVGYWDERSMEDENTSQFSRVIDINSICENNSSSLRYRLRPGHIAQSLHRRCLDSNSTLNLDNTVKSSIYSLDDAAHSNTVIFDHPASDASGYKQEYNSTITILRNDDNKTLISTITDENGNEIVVLKLISTNIGEVDYYKRTF